ncbi:hypothetical protein FN846DRAFT_373402 [Sphaerosporella brunnea]|uniref:Uncharacterized protein n=1 Tax=Sphaerosporella brunnea TaxID=1250544 RepID=A0A5J5EIL1_9PEZI|nr:hypothetical protein FN846DRAFT_373402 [Sphaerosporella brunnea]
MAMGPLVSWAVFLCVAAAVWYLNQRNKKTVPKKQDPLQDKEKPKALFVNAGGSGTDAAGEIKKKARKKTKKSTTAKEVPVVPKETESANTQSDDDDVAEEIDLRDAARRMKAQGLGASSLKPGASRNYAASQTSSTGADGDIDDEEFTAVKGSSSDPSDMLEASTGGPGVLRIGAPVQPPRGQKSKKSTASSEPGVHATKNAKKKEKKKAERAEERAEQQARFEQHRKAMRAEEAKQQQTRPAASPAPDTSAWTQVGASGKKSPAPAVTPVSEPVLLDIFTPADSADETITASTTLGDSWESIPRGLQVPEPEWNEVKSKKGRKDRKADDSDAPKSSDEREAAPKPKPVAPAPEFTRPAPVVPKPKATKVSNNFAALESRTTSGSDWTSIDDNVENWVAHPESSDY